MPDVVAIDGERVPLDQSLLGVHEGGAGVVVEEQRVAPNYLQIHRFRSAAWLCETVIGREDARFVETLDSNLGEKMDFGFELGPETQGKGGKERGK